MEGAEPAWPTRLTSAVLVTSSTQILVVGLSFIASVAQARFLGASGRGNLALFANAGALATLYLGLGISSALTYFVARTPGPHPGLLRRLALTYAAIVVVAAIVFSIVATSSLRVLLPSTLTPLLNAACLTGYFAFAQGGLWLTAWLAGRGEFRAVNVSAIGSGGFAVVGSVAALGGPRFAEPTLEIVVVVIAAEVVRVALLVPAAARPRSSGGGLAARERATVRHLVEFAGLSFVADAVQFLTYRIDMWFVGLYHGPAELGRYALAVSLAQLVWIVPSAAARVLFPYTATVGREKAAGRIVRAMKLILLASAGLGIGGLAVSIPLVTPVFGPGFEPVPGLIAVLLIGVIPYAGAKILGSYIAGAGLLRPNLGIGIGVLVVTILLDVALIPPLGALGAALASAVSYVLYTVLAWRLVRGSGARGERDPQGTR